MVAVCLLALNHSQCECCYFLHQQVSVVKFFIEDLNDNYFKLCRTWNCPLSCENPAKSR